MPTNNTPSRRTKKTVDTGTLLDPEVAKAVVEDAVMELAADVAAIAATEASAPSELLIAETPEEEAIFDIARVPYLGPSRILALAALGITTIDQLNEAPIEQIASLKGVGLKNATYIKNWVRQQLAGAEAAEVAVAIVDVPAVETVVIVDDLPPAPPVFGDAPASAPEDLHSGDSIPFDLATSDANQIAQDDLEEIDAAVRRFKDKLPKKDRSKSLKQQLDKIVAVVSEVPEGRDTLSTYGKKKVARTLDQIAKFVAAAAESDKFSDKKQEAIAEELKDLRKRLQKALED